MFSAYCIVFLFIAKGPPGTYSPKKRRTELKPATAATAVKESNDPNTLKQQLSKAWKRIAHLESCIDDLTFQSTKVSCYMYVLYIMLNKPIHLNLSPHTCTSSVINYPYGLPYKPQEAKIHICK